jgi:hypothetical protein
MIKINEGGKMKKKVIFLWLSVLLCTSTLVFAVEKKSSKIIDTLLKEKSQSSLQTSWFALTFYNMNRKSDSSRDFYLQNPSEKLKDIFKKELTSSEREEVLDEAVFTDVLGAIRKETENGGNLYEALIRRELVIAQIAIREEGKFDKELEFFKKVCRVSK